MSSQSSAVLKGENRILPGFQKSEQSISWNGPFFFVQAADTQLGLICNYGDGTIEDQYPNITWEREIELCKQSVEILNAMNPKPKAFIVCGDLIDAFQEKWPEIRKRQEEDFMKIYADLDKSIPLVCVCGNHDIGNTPTRETVAGYSRVFGDDYFSFWIGGVKFLVINSQFYEDSSQVPELADEQEKWLDEQLKDCGQKHTLVFQHIPPFVKTVDEAKFYFNLELDVRRRLLDKLVSGGVSKVFCGHYHRNAGGWYEDEKKRTLEVVVTTAIGCQIGPDTHGMRVVKVQEKEVTHEFHALDNFPRNVDL